MKIEMTQDIEVRDKILKALKQNGGYCPCAFVKNEDTKCMCREFRESSAVGPCHCGLYVREYTE